MPRRGQGSYDSFDEPEQVTIEAELISETDKAILVTTDDEDEIWLPRSQITIVRQGMGKLKIDMPEWLAKDKGLI